MRPRAPANIFAVVCVGLVACGGGKGDLFTTTVSLALSPDADCRPPGAARLEVARVGDFPAADDTVDLFDVGPEAIELDTFGPEVVALKFRARVALPEWEGSDLVEVSFSADSDRVAMLLPSAVVCTDDTEATFRQGAVSVALSDGSVLFGGGLAENETRASASAVRLRPGEAAVEFDMSERRIGAQAVRVGDRAVVLGGAPAAIGPAHSDYEVFDPEIDDFRLPLGTLCSADAPDCQGIRDHGAGVLPDGRILIVGGAVALGAAPRSAAKIVDIDAETVVSVDEIPEARIKPQVLVLDDGRVLVVGGFDADGQARGSVFHFSADGGSFTPLGDGDVLTATTAVAVPLPGGRIGWFAEEAREIELLLFGEGPEEFEAVAVPLEFSIPRNLHAVALAEGLVLLVGESEDDEPGAWVVDPGSGAARRTDARALEEDGHLLVASDGTIVEVDSRGIAYRREDTRSIFDNPPAPLTRSDVLGIGGLPGGFWLQMDAASHWDTSGEQLVALTTDARLIVPGLRFTDARFVLQLLEADGALVLLDAIGGRAEVTLASDSVSVGGCEAPRVVDSSVTLERRGSRLTISAGGDAAECATDLVGPASVEVHAEEGAAFRGLQIERAEG